MTVEPQVVYGAGCNNWKLQNKRERALSPEQKQNFYRNKEFNNRQTTSCNHRMHAHRVLISVTVDNNIINPRRAHALARVTVVGLCVCVSVCLSGLNLLLQASRATRYYTYVFSQ